VRGARGRVEEGEIANGCSSPHAPFSNQIPTTRTHLLHQPLPPPLLLPLTTNPPPHSPRTDRWSSYKCGAYSTPLCVVRTCTKLTTFMNSSFRNALPLPSPPITMPSRRSKPHSCSALSVLSALSASSALLQPTSEKSPPLTARVAIFHEMCAHPDSYFYLLEAICRALQIVLVNQVLDAPLDHVRLRTERHASPPMR
jgi:hypothetical protein